MHLYPMKDYPTHRFACDHCCLYAGEDVDEKEAFRKAQEKIDYEGWGQLLEYKWEFVCPSCLEFIRKQRLGTVDFGG